jgi:hypothetical protein
MRGFIAHAAADPERIMIRRARYTRCIRWTPAAAAPP